MRITNTGLPNTGGSVSIYRLLSDKKIIQVKNIPFGLFLKAIDFDSCGHAWVASTGDSKVYQIDEHSVVLNSYNQGGISGPWGLSIDGNDQIWVGNFESEGLQLKFSASHLCGNQPKTCPSGLTKGDPISPASGYTIPSAGSQVLLGNGQAC